MKPTRTYCWFVLTPTRVDGKRWHRFTCRKLARPLYQAWRKQGAELFHMTRAH